MLFLPALHDLREGLFACFKLLLNFQFNNLKTISVVIYCLESSIILLCFFKVDVDK